MQRLTWAKGKKKISSEKKYGMYNQCRPGFKLLQMKTLWQIKVSGWVELTCKTFCSKGEDISRTIIWKLLLQLLQFIAKKRYQIYQEKLSTFQTDQQPKILNFTGKKKTLDGISVIGWIIFKVFILKTMLSMSWNLAGCPPHDVRKTFINVLISDNPKRNESQCLEELLKS